MKSSILSEQIESVVRSSLPKIHSGVVLAVSGGLDSMVLLHILHKLKIPLAVAHVNYGKRGIESDKDQKLVMDSCAAIGLPCHVTQPAISQLSKGNFQRNARDFRYDFLNQLRDSLNYEWIATAHHRDDQIETQVLKLFRGESFRAVTGIQRIDHIHRIIRPLLPFDKQVLMRYAAEQNVQWREDASNAEAVYARNLLRNEMFPRLDKLIPGWRTNIDALASRFSAVDELISHQLKQLQIHSDTSVDVEKLRELSGSSRKAILHAFVTNWYPLVSVGQLQEIDALLFAQPGKYVELSDDVSVWRNRSELTVKLATPKIDEISEDQLVSDLPADYHQNHIHIRLQEIDRVENSELKKADKLFLNKVVLELPLKIRKWRAADMIQPYGMKGSVLVSDLLVSRKIQPSYKNEAIVIASFDGRICAVIFPQPSDKGLSGCIDHAYRIQDVSTEAIEINIEHHI